MILGNINRHLDDILKQKLIDPDRLDVKRGRFGGCIFKSFKAFDVNFRWNFATEILSGTESNLHVDLSLEDIEKLNSQKKSEKSKSTRQESQ